MQEFQKQCCESSQLRQSLADQRRKALRDELRHRASGHEQYEAVSTPLLTWGDLLDLLDSEESLEEHKTIVRTIANYVANLSRRGEACDSSSEISKQSGPASRQAETQS